MALNTQSVRTKLLGLLAGIALAGRRRRGRLRPAGLARSAARPGRASAGRYIATNLAFNAKYGVLTEDKPLLVQFLDGAVSASGSAQAGSDVVGGGDPRREGRRPRPDRQGAARRCPSALPTAGRGARGRHGRRRAGAALPRAGHRGHGRRRGRRPAAVRAETVKGGVEVAISQSALARHPAAAR